MLKRRRKTDRQRLIERADKLWADLIKRRDNYTCKRCGKQYEKGAPGIEASHIVPRGYLSTRFHPLNGKTLCTSCHLYWWHSDPTQSHEWAKGTFGEKRLCYLNDRRNLNVKYTVSDLQDIVENLKAVDVPETGSFKWPSPYPAEVDFPMETV